MSSCCRGKKISKEFSSTVESLKILAEENRLKILCMLNKGEKCVCEILPKLGIPQNLASHHLKVLKEAGFIVARKEGLRVFYSVDPGQMKKIQSILTHVFQSYDDEKS